MGAPATVAAQKSAKAPVTVSEQGTGKGGRAGDGGGAKIRKRSGSSLPIFKLAIANDPMVHLTPEAAEQLPMDQADIDQTLEIVEAHRLATARPNKVTSWSPYHSYDHESSRR